MTKLLSKRQLAEILGVSIRTIDRWRARGLDLGAVRIQGVVRFRPEVVEKKLAQKKALA